MTEFYSFLAIINLVCNILIIIGALTFVSEGKPFTKVGKCNIQWALLTTPYIFYILGGQP